MTEPTYIVTRQELDDERALADDLAAPMDDAALRDLAVEIADWLWTPDFQLDPDEINQKLVEYFAGPLARYWEARNK